MFFYHLSNDLFDDLFDNLSDILFEVFDIFLLKKIFCVIIFYDLSDDLFYDLFPHFYFCSCETHAGIHRVYTPVETKRITLTPRHSRCSKLRVTEFNLTGAGRLYAAPLTDSREPETRGDL